MAIDQPGDPSSDSHACEEGIAIVVDQGSVRVDDCYDLDIEINLAPLNVMRPESMGRKLKKRPGGRVNGRAQTAEAYKRKKGWPVVSKSAESNKDVNFVPTVYIKREIESTTTDDDVKPKDNPGVTTIGNNSGPGIDANNQMKEEVDDVNHMRSPYPGTQDSDGLPSFENFNTFIDGLLTNAKIFPGCQREVYYELCRERKGLLHRNLPKEISPGLVLGVIVQTTEIAEGMRAASSREHLAAWKRILKALQHLGMDVGFLCKRIDDLLGLLSDGSSTDQQPSVEHEGYEEVKLEKDHAAEKMGALKVKLEKDHAALKMRALKSRMSTLMDDLNALHAEVEELELSVKRIAQAMRQMANGPW